MKSISKSKPVIAAVGDVTSINTWSNIPWYFWQAWSGSKALQWDVPAFSVLRPAWNLYATLHYGKPGGFQYSRWFLDKAEALTRQQWAGQTVITFNQHFPRSASVLATGGKVYRYIDATLLDLLREPAYGLSLSKGWARQVVALERANYQQDAGIVTMGSWIVPTLVEEYGVDPKKIHTILPGANITLPRAYAPVPFQSGAGTERPFVMGFIGKDWKRKGLPILLAVRDALAARGYKVEVLAIGNCPPELQGREGLRYTGFVNKQHEQERFIELLQQCDIGCLFSEAEALGISVLEFLRLGIPVAGYYHQGMLDTLLEGASLRCSPAADIEELVQTFQEYITDSTLQSRLKHRAIQSASYVTWERSVQVWEQWLTG